MAQIVSRTLQGFLPNFKLKQNSERLTDQACLSLVGLALEKFARVRIGQHDFGG
ncbi:MAG: hypothetical protein ACRERV_17160 [Methylococcales bacterium]